MAGALEGIRILDLTQGVAGPLGILLLAEQGADVIKVERPGGDPFRAHPGYPVWNRSRRSITLDLKSDAGKEVFRRLLGTADVLAESFRPGVMQRLGFAYEHVKDDFPRLIYCSIPAYPAGSRHESRPGYEALVHARAGMQWEQQAWRPGPAFMHMPVASMATMFLVSIGIGAALYAREETGRGQHVETSLYQGGLAYTTMIWQWVERANASYYAMLEKSYPPGVHQVSIYECANGEWIHAATMSGLAPKRTQEDILGLPPGPDFATFVNMPQHEREKYQETIREAFRRHKRDELLEAFRDANLAAEPVVPMEEAFEHPQLVAGEMVVEVDDPEYGPTKQVGIPVKLEGTPGAVRGPQPRPGEHGREVLAELGYTDEETGRLAAEGVV